MANNESINRTVYFYAVDPGALATMSPVVDASPNGINCLWVAEGYAKQKLNSKGINTIDTDELFNKKQKGHHIVEVLVLGSQHNFGRTVDTLKMCSSLGIKTIFIFDHWCNYSSNFISSDDSMVIPTRILAMDYYVKSELMSLGIKESQIAIIGHPGIEDTVNAIKSIDDNTKKRIKKQLGILSKDTVILLVLELLKKSCAEGLEYEMVFSVLKALKTIERKDILLVARLHPRQSRSDFINFLDSYDITGSVILCPEGVSAAESLSIADIVIGMNSVLLLSSLTLRIPTISLKLDQKDFDRKIEIIPYLKMISFDKPSELSDSISEKLNQQHEEITTISLGSVGKAWDEIRKLI